MSEDNNLDLNLKSIRLICMCRVCLKRENLQPIHKYIFMVNGTLKMEDLTNKLAYCTDTKVFNSDKKPQYICEDCAAALIMAYSFKKLSQETEIKLNALINKVKSNVNVEEDSYREPFINIQNVNSTLLGNNSDISIVDSIVKIENIDSVTKEDIDTAVVKTENNDSINEEMTLNDVKIENVDMEDLLSPYPLDNMTFEAREERQSCINPIGSNESVMLQKCSEDERTDSLKNGYKCPHCTLVLRFKVAYDAHIVAHLKNPPLPCPHCMKIFTTSYLPKHMEMHSDEEKFVCKIKIKDRQLERESETVSEKADEVYPLAYCSTWISPATTNSSTQMGGEVTAGQVEQLNTIGVRREKETQRKREYRARKAATSGKTRKDADLDEAVKKKRSIQAARKREYRARKATRASTAAQPQPSTGTNDQISKASSIDSSIPTKLQAKRAAVAKKSREY